MRFGTKGCVHCLVTKQYFLSEKCTMPLDSPSVAKNGNVCKKWLLWASRREKTQTWDLSATVPTVLRMGQKADRQTLPAPCSFLWCLSIKTDIWEVISKSLTWEKYLAQISLLNFMYSPEAFSVVSCIYFSHLSYGLISDGNW